MVNALSSPLSAGFVAALFGVAFVLLGAPTTLAQTPEEEPVSLETAVLVSDSVLNQWLQQGTNYVDDEQYQLGAIKFSEIVKAADAANPIVQNAQFHLGAALYELRLYQSALSRFEAIVDQGDNHPRYQQTLQYLLRVSRATNSDPSVLIRIADYPIALYPADDADELHFLVGQFYYSEGALADALERFQRVTPRDADFYVRAKFLEGVVLVQQSGLGTEATEVDSEKLVTAGDAFKAILSYKRDKSSSSTIDRTSERAMLALGRLFYSTRQYDVSVKYYDQIGTDSPLWLESLYEVSWVHYQLKNYPRALGNLHTLNSPYFADQYFPESRVLQALILFYNCRYDESDLIVKEFVNDYYPLLQKLQSEINQFADPNAFYFWLAKLARSEDAIFSVRFKRIFNAALEDKKLRRKFDLVAKLNYEVTRIDQLSPESGKGLLQRLRSDITSYRTLVIGEAGALAQARLLRVLRDLKQHIGGALKIKNETLKARRGDSSDGVLNEQAAAKTAALKLEADSEHIEWPFTGEYWKDELGSYLYDIDSLCNSELE
jgi:outer membrane protein assembly factor BamD (BamD/ComL family)